MSAILALSMVVITSPGAEADPVPAPYSGATHGDIVSLDAAVSSAVLGAETLRVTLAHSATDVDSTGAPRSFAESATVDSAAPFAGLAGASLVEASADAPPSSTYDESLLELDVPLPPADPALLDTGLISGAGEANWAGDAACVTPGTPIAASSTTLAGATVGDLTIPLSEVPLSLLPDLGLTLAELGTVTTTGTVMLSPNGATNDVVATTTATAAAATLLNGRVTVGVAAPELTVTSTGSAGTIDYNNPLVSVTADLDGDGVFEIETTLQAEGGTLPLAVTLLDDAVVGTLTAAVTLSLAPDPSGATGAAATASVPAVVSVDLGLDATGALALLLGPELADLSLGLLPLSASATAPVGGVQCQLAPPVITAPLTGDLTTATPVIEGTGIAGATVEVTVDGVVVGTTTVAGDGTWAFPVTAPLPPGPHTVVATQTLEGLESGPSNEETFIVVAPPLIEAPDDGSSTSDTTPPISGAGQPGASLEVFVDGVSIGTVTVGDDGTWSTTPTTPLTLGEHVVTATQTIDGIVLDAEPVTFTVVAVAPPVITSPADGSTTSDTTPTIEGTGEPGATIDVIVDGESVGTTTVDEDGTWTLELTEPLAEGDHTVDAVQTVEGSVLDAEQVTFTVALLDAPVITSPGDGSTTPDTTPPVSGTGHPGATVTVTIDGEVVGTAQVGDDGTWTLQLTEPLSCGDHTVVATQSIGDQVSPASAPVEFTVSCPTALADTGAQAGLGLFAGLGLAMVAFGTWMVRRRWPAIVA